jgi:PAS domain S-box-containing protein
MLFLRNARISRKIFLLLGLLVALSAIIAGFAARNISDLAKDERAVVDVDASSLRWVASAHEHQTRAHQLLFEIVDTDFSASVALRARLLDEEAGVSSNMGRYHPLMTSDEATLYSDVQNGNRRYEDVADNTIRMLRSADPAGAKSLLLSSGVQAFAHADAAFDLLVDKQTLDMTREASAASQQAQNALWFLLLASAVGAAGVGALTIFIAGREITEPLIAITEAMARLAAGHLADELPPTDRRDEIGDLSRVLVVFRQNAIALLATQKEAEEQRRLLEIERLSGGFFRSAIESSLDSVRVLDLDGRVLFINRGGLDAFEIEDSNAYTGRLCQSLWPEPAATQIGIGIAAALRGDTHRFEGMCPTVHGVEKWWDVFIAPVRDETGALSAVIATSRDITDAHNLRVEAESRELELARTATALRLAFRVAHVGAWEVDFVSRRTALSPELCELLGSPPLPPTPIDEVNLVWIEEDRAPFLRELDRVETFCERLTFEGRTKAPDGSTRWWRLFGEPVIENGRCVAIRGAGQDVSDWRDLQDRERAAVHAAEAMSGFLATMSHELRTPLNGVLGMAQAMARDPLSPPQRERLSVIEGSGEALLSLLNDLLDLSKIEAGKTVLEDGVVDAKALADGAQSIFTALVGDKNVALNLSVEPGAAGCWRGDPTRVRQVLHNLISNAVKFTDRGSITVDLSHSAEGLTFRVTDTGVGIPPDKLGGVFDRFVQADASTTRRHGGSGLGLTICRDLVALMGGAIEVESIEGVGTTFTVKLPLARAESATPDEVVVEHADDLAASGPGLRVLAAEDNLTNQFVLKTLLAQVGIELTLAPNGQEAVDAWRASLWDLVLMDIQMPVMDGVTAVRQIRQAERQQGLKRTPIIALTANAMAHHRAEYLAAGMDAVVAKPIDFAGLLETMDAVMTAAEAEQAPAKVA